MPAIEQYRRDLTYAYAPGIFPSMEAVLHKPECVLRLLISSNAADSEGVKKLKEICMQNRVRYEVADKALTRLSGKNNCYAAIVFEKFYSDPRHGEAHIVLYHPSDNGNMGTILRTALGFGYDNIVIIRPAADVFDPHAVRASMGAIFSLYLREYNSFDEYRTQYPENMLYPFMLDGTNKLSEVARNIVKPYSLIFGSEGDGLPAEFAGIGKSVRITHNGKIDSLNLSIAAAIGMYAFESGAEE